jgi:alpha-L-rhamnosidase
MKPEVAGDLTLVKAEYESVRGTVKSHWQRTGNQFHWEIEIPPGTTATVQVPNGETVKVNSGKHQFNSTLKSL